MASFLGIGECMVELAPAGDGLFQRGFAGDTFNTAWYARRLLPADWTVGYATCIGEDDISDQFTAFMTNAGLDGAALRAIPDRTLGLYMISLTDGERSFSYWRSHSAARLLADDPGWLDRIFAQRDILHFSGITLAILAPHARETLCAALARARARGARVAFDTNLRPRLWESPQAMRHGIELGASVADIVLPSFDEDAGLFGDDDPGATIARYQRLGADTIAVKNAGQPLTLWSAGTGVQTLNPPAVTPIDSTAAGDSFAASLLAGLATGQSLDDAGEAAMGLAARVIQHPGALVPQIFEGDQT